MSLDRELHKVEREVEGDREDFQAWLHLMSSKARREGPAAYIHALQSEDWQRRWRALSVLQNMGFGVIDVFLEAFNHEDEFVCWELAKIILSLGPSSFPSLIKAFERGNEAEKYGILWVFAHSIEVPSRYENTSLAWISLNPSARSITRLKKRASEAVVAHRKRLAVEGLVSVNQLHECVVSFEFELSRAKGSS